MFGSLFRQAQETVDNAIGQLVSRIVIAVPFLVALGFATAALSSWLTRNYGAEMANLILAAGYAGIGLVAAIVVSVRGAGARTEPLAEPQVAAAEAPSEDKGQPKFSLNDIDKDLLVTALTTAAPIALPAVMRGLLRNIPLVLLIAVAGFILNRVLSAETPAAEPVAEAAE